MMATGCHLRGNGTFFTLFSMCPSFPLPPLCPPKMAPSPGPSSVLCPHSRTPAQPPASPSQLCPHLLPGFTTDCTSEPEVAIPGDERQEQPPLRAEPPPASPGLLAAEALSTAPACHLVCMCPSRPSGTPRELPCEAPGHFAAGLSVPPDHSSSPLSLLVTPFLLLPVTLRDQSPHQAGPGPMSVTLRAPAQPAPFCCGWNAVSPKFTC